MLDKKSGLNLKDVHKVLGRRLIVAALILSILLGAGVWLSEYDKISADVTERAIQGASIFNSQIRDLLDESGVSDREGVKREVEAFHFASRNLVDSGKGHFVFSSVYDRDAGTIIRIFDDDYLHIEALEASVTGATRPFPRKGEIFSKILKVANIPHIYIAAPLLNSKGTAIAYINGIFAISHDMILGFKKKAFRMVLLSIGVVVLTTLLLYPIIVLLIRKVTTMSLNLQDSHIETLKVLGSAVAKRDSDTDSHNYRVTIISVRLAEACGLDQETVQSLIKGAFLHDVGKIGIRDDILLKPAKLTEGEFDVMKHHVFHGLDIVKRSSWLQDAIEVVGFHHEKFDGSGYGQGLSGNDIPVKARIFAIADVFDALTSKRPYKEPFSYTKAMVILEEGRGIHFDPDLLDRFKIISGLLFEELVGCDHEELTVCLDNIIRVYFPRAVEIKMEKVRDVEKN